MRDLGPFARRSAGRQRYRAFYDTYIASDLWRARRAAWAGWAEGQLASEPIRCLVCRQPWRLHRDDLHHCDYDRLGHEADEDLWPLCRRCHTELHDLLQAFRGYRRMPKRQANHLALAALQRTRANT